VCAWIVRLLWALVLEVALLRGKLDLVHRLGVLGISISESDYEHGLLLYDQDEAIFLRMSCHCSGEKLDSMEGLATPLTTTVGET